jgi:hypothetical protein
MDVSTLRGGNFNLDNIECQTRMPLSGQDQYEISARDRSPMKNELLLKLSEGQPNSRMSMKHQSSKKSVISPFWSKNTKTHQKSSIEVFNVNYKSTKNTRSPNFLNN